MRDYWPEIRQAIIIVLGFLVWVALALLFAAVRMELLTDAHQLLVVLWVLAVVCGVRALWYTLTPREERPTFVFRRPFFRLRVFWEFDLQRGLDEMHDTLVFCIHPYGELAILVYVIVLCLFAVYPR